MHRRRSRARQRDLGVIITPLAMAAANGPVIHSRAATEAFMRLFTLFWGKVRATPLDYTVAGAARRIMVHSA